MRMSEVDNQRGKSMYLTGKRQGPSCSHPLTSEKGTREKGKEGAPQITGDGSKYQEHRNYPNSIKGLQWKAA